MGSLKPEERITKTSQDGSSPIPQSPPRSRRAFGYLKRLLVIAVLAGALGAGYNYYLLHRPTTEAEIVQIESLISAQKGDEARALMAGAQVRSKDVDAIRLRVGRAFLREGQIGPATALLSKVEGSLIKEERLAIAEYFLVSGDPFSASRFFEGAIKAGLPKTASLLGRYGESLSLAGNGEGAVAAFREALALDDSRLRVRLNLAVTLANVGRFEEAKTETLAVLKTEPTNTKALQLLAALSAAR
jgi:Tfp pilus assembly protein PilF